MRYFRKKYLRFMGVSIGKGGMISLGAHIDVARGKIYIGNNVVITNGCYVLSHNIAYARLNRVERISKQTIIEDNVFVGVNSVILPGLRIGENSIIGAGSVVTKDIPPNTVAVGNPAKVSKYI
jgi:acetyltransferase-like isoleucine patch superfamily enzyme